MKRSVFILALVSSITVVLFLSQAGHTADTIKVGIVDTYSGPHPCQTQDVLDGFNMAVEKINAKGGVLGKKIEFTTRDEKFKPDVGLAMAKELVLKEGWICSWVPSTVPQRLAISDFARKEKCHSFVTMSKSDKIVGEKKGTVMYLT